MTPPAPSTRAPSTVLGAAFNGDAVAVRHADGRETLLDSGRWAGPARGADLTILSRVVGGALDVGCGPGRLASALAKSGTPALGIDVDPTAVRLAREAGCACLRRSVFARLPAEGRWANLLLADGNIGIGGDPLRLLQRTAELLAADGQALVEVGPPGQGVETGAVRLEHPAAHSAWFRWSRVGVDALPDLASAAGLRIDETWSARDGRVSLRWFARLRREGAASARPGEQPAGEQPAGFPRPSH